MINENIMKTKIYKLIRIFAVLTLSFVVLNSCTDDDTNPSIYMGNSRITLTLPTDNIVNINTRSNGSSEGVTNVLVCITNGSKPVKTELLTDFTFSGNNISLTLKKLLPASGDKLHVFCNVDMTKISNVLTVNTEDDLLTGITTSDALADHIIMYGSTSSFNPEIKIMLKRSLAKVSLNISESTNLSIVNWAVHNLPTDSYISEDITGYPSGTQFSHKIKLDTDVSNSIYMAPRKDNGAVENNTYLIVQLSNEGWYKLEFQKDNNILPINANNSYLFKITSVTNDGYSTEDEAKANPGSNLVYSLDVVQPNNISNGQYAIQLSKEVIPLSGTPSSSLAVLDVTALFTSMQSFNIETYTVELYNPNGGLTLVDAEPGSNKYSVLEKIPDITQTHTIKLSIGQDAQLTGSYLEIRLGNLVKSVPIRLNTANCYLADFNSATDVTLKIPIDQANRITERIADSDHVIPKILWSDLPLVEGTDVMLEYKNQYIEITNKKKFVGNFVVGAVVDDVIKWSWHVWVLDASVIEYNSDLGVYDFRSEKVQEYCNKKWMDRNLGAYDLSDFSNVAARGFVYQFGRKDPFTSGNIALDGLLTSDPLEPTLYYGSQGYTMEDGHPFYGACSELRNTTKGTTNLEYSIQNPTKFLCRKGWLLEEDKTDPSWHLVANSDWYTSYKGDVDFYLWQDPKGSKWVYDPCPIGWKVPDGGLTSPWAGIEYDPAINKKDLAVVIKGKNGDIIYPYAPSRGHMSTFAINNSTGEGSIFWWANQKEDVNYHTTFVGSVVSSTSESTFGYYYNMSRVNGLYVRCVRE